MDNDCVCPGTSSIQLQQFSKGSSGCRSSALRQVDQQLALHVAAKEAEELARVRCLLEAAGSGALVVIPDLTRTGMYSDCRLRMLIHELSILRHQLYIFKSRQFMDEQRLEQYRNKHDQFVLETPCDDGMAHDVAIPDRTSKTRHTSTISCWEMPEAGQANHRGRNRRGTCRAGAYLVRQAWQDLRAVQHRHHMLLDLAQPCAQVPSQHVPHCAPPSRPPLSAGGACRATPRPVWTPLLRHCTGQGEMAVNACLIACDAGCW